MGQSGAGRVGLHRGPSAYRIGASGSANPLRPLGLAESGSISGGGGIRTLEPPIRRLTVFETAIHGGFCLQIGGCAPIARPCVRQTRSESAARSWGTARLRPVRWGIGGSFLLAGARVQQCLAAVRAAPLGGGRLRRFARRLWRFARRLWLAVGGFGGFRSCFSLRRPLPGVTRHVVQALGDVPRGRRHLVERVRRLPPDLPPRLVHQALQPLLVFLKPGKVITALLGHTHGLPRTTPATQPGRAPREPGNGCHRARSAKQSM